MSMSCHSSVGWNPHLSSSRSAPHCYGKAIRIDSSLRWNDKLFGETLVLNSNHHSRSAGIIQEKNLISKKLMRSIFNFESRFPTLKRFPHSQEFDQSFTLATIYSRFIRAIFSNEMPFGHSISQAPVLVQLPKPSLSICSTIFNTRRVASTLPCGNNAN